MNVIHFIGAGPGDPELLTLKGRRLLDQADLVVYAGSLVNPALLENIHAKTMNSATMTLGEITAAMIQAWRRGDRVARLHTGDPAIYGAIREQMRVLDEHDIPYEVVPGVSSAAAAAAALKAELTLPEVSQSVIITRRAGRTPVPAKETIASFAAHQATMLIFLSVGMIADVARELAEGGYPPDTPVAVVEKASWPEERAVRGTLADIADKVTRAGITKTAIIAVGRVLADAPPAARSKLYDKAFAHGCRETD